MTPTDHDHEKYEDRFTALSERMRVAEADIIRSQAQIVQQEALAAVRQSAIMQSIADLGKLFAEQGRAHEAAIKEVSDEVKARDRLAISILGTILVAALGVALKMFGLG